MPSERKSRTLKRLLFRLEDVRIASLQTRPLFVRRFRRFRLNTLRPWAGDGLATSPPPSPKPLAEERDIRAVSQPSSARRPDPSAFTAGLTGEAHLIVEVAEGRFAGAQVHLHFRPGQLSGVLRQGGRRVRRCRW
ncbi:MAG: hypothetical protein AAGD10_03915 [Myxococcota bacterium]